MNNGHNIKHSNNSLNVVDSLSPSFSLYFFTCLLYIFRHCGKYKTLSLFHTHPHTHTHKGPLIAAFTHLTPVQHTAVLDLSLTLCAMLMAKCLHGLIISSLWKSIKCQLQLDHHIFFCINNLNTEHLFKQLVYLDLHKTCFTDGWTIKGHSHANKCFFACFRVNALLAIPGSHNHNHNIFV